MPDTPITDTLFDYLLASCDGARFEALVQALLGIREGDLFVALGGVHDGGADGFLRATYETQRNPDHFIQISKQEDVPTKVRDTVKRLREVGRDVKTLTYWSSRRFPNLDILEEKLSTTLAITVRIRDRNALLRLANHNAKTRDYFQSAFRAEIFDLTAKSEKLSEYSTTFASDPSVFAFLQFESEERFSKGGTTKPVVDALIYWSLRDTDPAKDQLLSRDEVKDRIQNVLPGAAANLLPMVDERLDALSSKAEGGVQRIRAYQKLDHFCLPHVMRIALASASAKEIVLQDSVRRSLRERAEAAGASDPVVIAGVCERAIYKHFEEQGLVLAAFLEKRLEGITFSDQVVEEELRQVTVSSTVQDQKSYSAALTVLREVFYTPNDAESEFLRRLSRTSLLLFSLKHCPPLIEYFNQLTGHFRLLIGTDILIKSIAETFLAPQHRHVTNLLKVAKACGATLLLTEPVMDEIFTHLHAQYLEFRNHYAPREPYITRAIASQSDRILIRMYFYAKLLLQQVTGWKAFINKFVDPDELENKSSKGKAQLQAYLCKVLDLEYMPLADISAGVRTEELDVLTKELEKRDLSKHELLARNDALMVLSVYAQRKAHREVEKYDGFGLRTWWLTKENKVLAYTGAVVVQNGRIPYIMRPEFLLNFLTLSPAGARADEASHDILPSHVGLQIGEHLPQSHMHRLLDAVDEWKDLGTARIEIKMTDAIDRLKFDRLKRYESQLDLQGDSEADLLIKAVRQTTPEDNRSAAS